MARAKGKVQGAVGQAAPQRASKNQRRITTILSAVPSAREQLFAAVEAVGSPFSPEALGAAAVSADVAQRNNVAAIERNVEKLINYMEELAARGLNEGQRLGTVKPTIGQLWARMVALDIISSAAAARLLEAKETRNDLGHAYPPQMWRGLYKAVNIVLGELDGYLMSYRDWAVQTGILPPAPTV
jgi:hypothetical protein